MAKNEPTIRTCHFCKHKRVTKLVDKRTPACKPCLAQLNKKFPEAKLIQWE